MPTDQIASQYSLTIEREVQATPETVFKAWTSAEILQQWFAPSDDFTVNVTACDAQEGGRYRIEMHDPDGSTHVVTGTFIQIQPPSRLVMTWGWEGGDGDPEMLVSVDFKACDNGTLIHLLHEQLPSEQSRDHHHQGWNGCLDRLPGCLG